MEKNVHNHKKSFLYNNSLLISMLIVAVAFAIFTTFIKTPPKRNTYVSSTSIPTVSIEDIFPNPEDYENPFVADINMNKNYTNPFAN
jgi:hypothetical protein